MLIKSFQCTCLLCLILARALWAELLSVLYRQRNCRSGKSVFPAAHRWQSQGLLVVQTCGYIAVLCRPCSPEVEARREVLGRGQAGLRYCGVEEKELRSVGGTWARFLFICPRRISQCLCCRCSTGFCPGSHWPPAASAPCHRPGWPGNLLQEGIWPPCPQKTADWPAPGVALEILLVPAHIGVLSIPQEAPQGFSLSPTYQGPPGLLLHQTCIGTWNT